MAGLITLVISIVSGLITGYIARALGDPKDIFLDDEHWNHVHYPEEYIETDSKVKFISTEI